MSKIEKLAKSVEHVRSSSMLALGGMTLYRRPMAFVLNLIRRYYQTGEPNNLTLLSFAAGMESDLLVGAGMVSRVRACYFGLEIFGLAPMFTYYANRGKVEVIEETEASLAFGLRAEIAGVAAMIFQLHRKLNCVFCLPDKHTEDMANLQMYICTAIAVACVYSTICGCPSCYHMSLSLALLGLSMLHRVTICKTTCKTMCKK